VSQAGKKHIKVHRVALDGMDLLPQLWRTSCGVKFGLWAFLRHASVEAFPPDARCANCFDRSSAGSPVGSNSSSDSSLGESVSAGASCRLQVGLGGPCQKGGSSLAQPSAAGHDRAISRKTGGRRVGCGEAKAGLM